MIFKLYLPSGKAFMTKEFDDANVRDGFSVNGRAVTYTDDITIEISRYATVDRAFEVYDEIVNAYNAHKSFTLPEM